MLNRWLPRTPAFAGLHPEPPRFDRADQATARWLQQETRLMGEVSRLRSSAEPPYGHFRLLGAMHRCFLKVLTAEEARHHQRADAIARCAQIGGADVLPPGSWIETARGPWIGVYPYLEGRYGEATVGDASILGVAIARLHKALQTCEVADEVRSASFERMRMLANRHMQILNQRGPMGPNPGGLLDLLSRDEEPFEVPPDGQIVHGDLNLGNFLFDVQTGLPTFIDFETASVSWLSPRIDVAMALQRLCLVTSSDDAQRAATSKALLSAYGSITGKTPFGSISELVGTLRWISIRNLCLLAEMEDAGKCVQSSEWQKFIILAAAADNSSHFLEDVFSNLS